MLPKLYNVLHKVTARGQLKVGINRKLYFLSSTFIVLLQYNLQ